MVENMLFLFNCTFEKVEDNMDYKTVTTKGGDKLEYAWRFYTISNAPVEAFIENKEAAINIIKKEGFKVEFNLDELEKHKLRKTDQKKMEILESLEELELYPEDLPLSMIPEIIVGTNYTLETYVKIYDHVDGCSLKLFLIPFFSKNEIIF